MRVVETERPRGDWGLLRLFLYYLKPYKAPLRRVYVLHLINSLANLIPALSLRYLAGSYGESGLGEITDRIEKDLAPAFLSRGLTLIQVSRAVDFQYPRQVAAAFAETTRAVSQRRQKVQAAAGYRDRREADLPAEIENIVGAATNEAQQIQERAKRDVTRTAELAAVVRENPSLRRRLVLEAFREVLKKAVVHPIAAGGGKKEYRVRLQDPAGRATAVEEEAE